MRRVSAYLPASARSVGGHAPVFNLCRFVHPSQGEVADCWLLAAMNCLANSDSFSRFQDFRPAAAGSAPSTRSDRSTRSAQSGHGSVPVGDSDFIVKVDKESARPRTTNELGDVGPVFSAVVQIVDVYNGVGDNAALTDPMCPRLLRLTVNNLVPAWLDTNCECLWRCHPLFIFVVVSSWRGVLCALEMRVGFQMQRYYLCRTVVCVLCGRSRDVFPLCVRQEHLG